MRISQVMNGAGSHPLLRDFLFFLATVEACLPSAVRTDFGKCAIVRFRFAADAAFLMFFFAALLCLVDAICSSSVRFQMAATTRRLNVPSVLVHDWMTICMNRLSFDRKSRFLLA